MQAMPKMMQFKFNDKIYAIDASNFNVSYSGMATPFGIRIYSSCAHAGVSDTYMYLTGAIYGIVIFACQYAAGTLNINNPVVNSHDFKSLMGLFLYLLVMRFTPISSIHASEHQVIHAMEKDTMLNHESVKQQSRIHPRCGTNLMAGLLLFTTCVNIINSTAVASWAKVVCAIPMFFVSCWLSEPVGTFLQQYFTTKTARDKDIDAALEAGLQHNFQFVSYLWRNAMPTGFKLFLMKIQHSGLGHMLLAHTAAYLLLMRLFPIPQ